MLIKTINRYTITIDLRGNAKTIYDSFVANAIDVYRVCAYLRADLCPGMRWMSCNVLSSVNSTRKSHIRVRVMQKKIDSTSAGGQIGDTISERSPDRPLLNPSIANCVRDSS